MTTFHRTPKLRPVLALAALVATALLTVPLGAEELFTVDLGGGETIDLPRGRPAYAFLVNGYARNNQFNELHFYDFGKYLAEQGAYVHWSWWNNLLHPYMRGPLHDLTSNSGDLTRHVGGFVPLPNVLGIFDDKANPAEDTQFQKDAKAVLRRIQLEEPHAAIVLVGHSMGGGAVARLADSLTDVEIDLVGLIDPVGNRSLPLARLDPLENWTRKRATHNNFLGYKQVDCKRSGPLNACDLPLDCRPIGPWRQLPPARGGWLPTLTPLCAGQAPHEHSPARRKFGPNVAYVFHRWQKEFLFPFDYQDNQLFNLSTGSTSDQEAIRDCASSSLPCTCSSGTDPIDANVDCHARDGHGEIVGYRDFPFGDIEPAPLGVVTRNWAPNTADAREARLRSLSVPGPWPHAPAKSYLCLVSEALKTVVQQNIDLPVFTDGFESGDTSAWGG